MRALIVDASALLRLVLAEPGGEVVHRELLRRRTAGAARIVPSLLWVEILNVLARRHAWRGSALIEALHELDRLGFETRDVGRSWAVPILDAVERHGLTAYDAAYLVLAETTRSDLLTADRELARAAGSRAIYVDETGGIAEPPDRYELEPTWPTWRGAAAYLGELRRQAADDAG
jgi:predicted nucleic acid-binding protein